MRRQWLSGSWAKSLLCVAVLLMSNCSSQQEGQEELESSQQENAQIANNSEGSDGEDFSANTDVGALEGGNNEFLGGNNELLGANNAAGGNFAAEGNTLAGSNDLTNIINEMNQQGASANIAGIPPAVEGASSSLASPMPAAGHASMASGGLVAGLAGAAAGPGLPELGSKLAYIVKKGDTLAKIASKILGDAQRYQDLATLSNIDNPSRIYPGDVIYYQLNSDSLAFATDYENSSRHEVTVQAGDTLTIIAERLYGSSKQWRSLWRQNGQITDPNALEVGSSVYYDAQQTLASVKKVNTNKHKDIKTKLSQNLSSPSQGETISVEVLGHGLELTTVDNFAVDYIVKVINV